MLFLQLICSVNELREKETAARYFTELKSNIWQEEEERWRASRLSLVSLIPFLSAKFNSPTNRQNPEFFPLEKNYLSVHWHVALLAVPLPEENRVQLSVRQLTTDIDFDDRREKQPTFFCKIIGAFGIVFKNTSTNTLFEFRLLLHRLCRWIFIV